MYNIFPGLTSRVLSLRKDVLQLQFIPDVHRGILEASNKNMGERLRQYQERLSRLKRVLGQTGDRFIGYLEKNHKTLEAARYGPLSFFTPPGDSLDYWNNNYRQEEPTNQIEDKKK